MTSIIGSQLVFFALGIALFALGLHGLLALQNGVRRVIAVNIMGSGVFMVLIALAARISPIDPVLQALAVTGLVVAVSATAFALSIIEARQQLAARQTAGQDAAGGNDTS